LSILSRLFQHNKREHHLDIVKEPLASEVEVYYEKETESYLNSYGDIIQAARPTSGEAFLDYLMNSMEIEDGMKLIDAGCGVCGPSIHFTKKKNITIDALTLSSKQVEISKERIKEAKVEEKLRVQKGDFHFLDNIYPENSYDVVFFLEALGYSSSLYPVIKGAYKVLKPQGHLYIKDFFPVPLTNDEHYARQMEITKEIRHEYCYRLLDLVNLITVLRESGFFVVFIRRLDFIEDFTNAANFESRNGYSSYTRAITNPYQLYEPLELKFQKMF